MESIVNKAVATATDISLALGTRGGPGGMLLTSEDPPVEPAGFSASLAHDLYLIVHSVITTIYSVVTTIVQNPFLLFMSGFVVLGLAISVFGYMLRGD